MKSFRWESLGITITLFGAVDLVTTLLVPDHHRGWLLLPPAAAAVCVLFAFPYVVAFFDRQQERIERLRRELETLHAMDTAIVSEMEIDRVLYVAVQSVMRAVDAVAGGVVIVEPGTEATRFEAFQTPDHTGDVAARFHALVRSGGRPDPLWEAIVCPLGEDTGQVTGYIAAARHRPARAFTAGDKALAAALAGTVAVAVRNAESLESARQAAHVQADAERIRADAERDRADAALVRVELARERRVAQALTEGLLPQIAPRVGTWQFSVHYEAQSDEAQVGGDIYDQFEISRGRWGFVIADVSGKGLLAAQKTAMVKYSLRSYAREHASPAQVLARLNDTLSDEDAMTGFVTLFYGVLDEESGHLTYASAGHEPPVLRRANGAFETLQPTGMVLGAMRDMPYEDETADLEPGDGLLLYTDGLTEARSATRGQFLTIEGVQTMLGSLRDCPPLDVADCLWEIVRRFTGDRQLDDTALLWVYRSDGNRADVGKDAMLTADAE